MTSASLWADKTSSASPSRLYPGFVPRDRKMGDRKMGQLPSTVISQFTATRSRCVFMVTWHLGHREPWCVAVRNIEEIPRIRCQRLGQRQSIRDFCRMLETAKPTTIVPDAPLPG